MQKEHVFNIAIAIDDDAIQQAAIDYCAKQIDKGLTDGYLKKGTYRNEVEFDYKLAKVIDEHCQEFLETHKDEIINAVTDKLVDKVFRTKAFKEKVSNIVFEDSRN